MGQVLQPVHLERAFSDAPPAIQEVLRDKILHAACRASNRQKEQPVRWGVVTLYVRVPRVMRAWVHCKIAPSDPSAPVPLTVGQRIASEQTKRQPGLSPSAFSVPDPDIHFLKLDEEHVADLAVHHRTRVQRFSGALRVVEPPPGTQLAREYASADVVAPVRVRPWEFFNADVSQRFPIGDLQDDPQYEMAIELGDVYLDRLIVLRLRNTFNLPLSNWDTLLLRQETGNLLQLPSSVYGVNLLYKVAKEQYTTAMIAEGSKLPVPKAVAAAFHSRDARLFSKSVRAPQAARLTRPGVSRNQGLPPGENRDFTAKARHILDTEYALRGSFVSDALALIVLATQHWLRLDAAPLPDVAANARALLDELHSYGFRGDDEIEAIFAFITWKKGRFTHPPKDATPSPA